jgi:phosphomevalonate kinase
MTPVLVSAPGKAIVSGEYAVLAGAPAISMALDRRASVRIAAATDDYHRVATPGYREGEWRFRWSPDGKLEWQDRLPPQGLGLVEHAWMTTVAEELPPLAISVDTTAFSDRESGSKLGLGSSAAAMTALVVALSQFAEQQEFAGVLSTRAHAALQGGLGSGVDIATSLRGGVIEYRANEYAEAAHLSWPGDLLYRVLWSGQPADTSIHLSRLNTGNPSGRSWVLLSESANNVAAAWKGGRVGDILEAISEYTTSLKMFDREHVLGIFNAGHKEVCDQAEDRGVAYKPCGAGGGDIGIVFGTDSAAVNSFCEKTSEYGFVELPVALDVTGVSVSTEEPK